MDSTRPGRIAALPDRGVVAVAGEGARQFLQDLITADIGRADGEAAVYGGLLSPQGKILFDFLVSADGAGGYLFDLPRTMTADFAKRLAFYRLRAKVEIADRSESLSVQAAWGGLAAPAHPGIVVRDGRLAALGWRIVSAERRPVGGREEASPLDYRRHRIGLAIPEGGEDFAYGDAYPHEVGMDALGGVDFKKGCYVGQEVVSRMEHRGSGRRRIVAVSGAGALPTAGTDIIAGGRLLGTLGSAVGSEGLALVRLDRAAAAREGGLAITAADIPLDLALPAWSGSDWPAGSGEAVE
ncbi:MAG: folate-binding protein [Bauldia sp.]